MRGPSFNLCQILSIRFEIQADLKYIYYLHRLLKFTDCQVQVTYQFLTKFEILKYLKFPDLVCVGPPGKITDGMIVL